MSEPAPKRDDIGVVIGVAITMVLHVVCLVPLAAALLTIFSIVDLGEAAAFVPVVLFGAIGISQAIYVGPAAWYAHRRGRVDVARGILLGAGMTVLLNAACWGAVRFVSPQ